MIHLCHRLSALKEHLPLQEQTLVRLARQDFIVMIQLAFLKYVQVDTILMLEQLFV